MNMTKPSDKPISRNGRYHKDMKITTVVELRHAVRVCAKILIPFEYGHERHWVAISRKDAVKMIHNFKDYHTPKYLNMKLEIFGETVDNALFLSPKF